MRTLKQQLTSKLNGQISRGPVTTEGRVRWSQNAVKHGIHAKAVVLANESPICLHGRAESRLHRTIERATEQLLALKTEKRENEPAAALRLVSWPRRFFPFPQNFTLKSNDLH